MPLPGQVNNPEGTNAYGGGGKEEPYGALERRKNLTSLAPPPGASALQAPRRAQRNSQRKKKASTSAIPPEPAVAVAPNPLQDFWERLAAEPGASDLVRQFAAEATNAA